MVQQNDEKHEKGHARLRDDWRDHETRLDRIEQALAKVEKAAISLGESQAAPIDIGKIVFAPKMVLAIVALVMVTVAIVNTSAPGKPDYGVKYVTHQIEVVDPNTATSVVLECTLAVVPGRSVAMIGCAPQ